MDGTLLKTCELVDIMICSDNTCFVNMYQEETEKVLELRFRDYESILDFMELNDLEISKVTLVDDNGKEIFVGANHVR